MTTLSINQTTTFRWTFEEDVQNYAAAGIPAIGVWRQKLSDFGDDKGIELLADRCLAVSSLLWAGGFTGSDGRSHADAVADAAEAITRAAEMKAGCLIVYSGGRAGHTHNHARRLLKSALDKLIPLASAAGVTLAVKPMHPGCAIDWTFVTDLQEAVALVDSDPTGTLKLAFDTYHFGHEPSLMSELPSLTPKIALLQLGDAKQRPNGEQNRCRLGEGTIPLDQIVPAVLQAGYDGYLEVELMGEDVEASDYQDLLAQSKSAVESLLATSAPS